LARLNRKLKHPAIDRTANDGAAVRGHIPNERLLARDVKLNHFGDHNRCWSLLGNRRRCGQCNDQQNAQIGGKAIQLARRLANGGSDIDGGRWA